jgi:hypothetical protein
MPRGVPNNSGVTKTEMVRQALAELGPDAKPKAISAWAKKKFKVALNPNSISVLKAAVNKKGNETSQPSQTESPVNKMEAVRQALNTMDQDAKPAALRDHIQQKLGLDLDAQLISNYKVLILKKAGGQSAVIRKPMAGHLNGFSIEEIESVRDVVSRMGADRVRELAQVLGK